MRFSKQLGKCESTGLAVLPFKMFLHEIKGQIEISNIFSD